ncbi:MAG: GNAT family N-acetyltransferase [Acidobacteriota bacterium]
MLKGWRTRSATQKDKRYLKKLEDNVKLRDGSRLSLRPIKPDDDVKLLDLYRRLSPTSLYHRFFTVPKPDPNYAKYLADVDAKNHFALVAEFHNQIVGVARFHRGDESSQRAEAAVTVADDWQGKGVGSMLLKKLAAVAVQQTITEFECQVALDNEAMKRLLSHSGFKLTSEVKEGRLYITLLLKRDAGQPRKRLIRRAGKL